MVTVMPWPGQEPIHFWPPPKRSRYVNPWSRRGKQGPGRHKKEAGSSTSTGSTPATFSAGATAADLDATEPEPAPAEDVPSEDEWQVLDDLEAEHEADELEGAFELEPLLNVYLDMCEAEVQAAESVLSVDKAIPQERPLAASALAEEAGGSTAAASSASEQPQTLAQVAGADALAAGLAPADMPPPPPPQPPVAKAKAQRGKSKALANLAVPGRGKISYHDSKKAFEAICEHHPNCTMTRAAYHSARVSGRPLGLLSAWLLMDATAADHKDRQFLHDALDLETRTAGRNHLASLGDAAPLFALEREKLSDLEPDEPPSLKGLL